MDQPPSYDEAVCAVPSYELDLLQTRATVMLFPHFNLKTDVRCLHAALEVGDKDMLIRILCRRSTHQRLEIARLYNSIHKIPMARDIKNRISNYSNFSVLMCGLSMPIHEFMARAVHNTQTYRWMCCIMFVLPNYVRHEMKLYFKSKYGTDMVKFIKSKIHCDSDHADQYLVSQIVRPVETVRDESSIVATKAELMNDVNLLLNMDKKNREQKEMVKCIFYSKNFAHIKTLAQEYQKCAGHPISTLLEKQFKANKNILTSIVTFALDPVLYFAMLLKRSMKGVCTNTKILSSVVLLRCEVDMLDIKEKFRIINGGKPLRNWIRDDTSGYYRNALFELIAEPMATSAEKQKS